MDRNYIHTTNRLASRGTKRTCLETDCGRSFYDLNRGDIHCPYCGALFVSVADVAVKRFLKSPQYKIEKPQPTFIEPEEQNDEENTSSDVDGVEDTGGEAPLLSNDDQDDDDTVLDRTKLSPDD